MRQMSEYTDMERIPTGIISLDGILDGGLPRGQMIEAFGPEGGGKSLIATMAAARAQKYGNVIYIDLENAFDPEKAENCGVNVDDLWVPQPGSAEAVLKLMDQVLHADDVSLIVIDSTAAMATEAEINGDYGDANVAGLARLLSPGLRKLAYLQQQEDSQTILFWVNQLREKVGGMGGFTSGPTTYTPGGRAMKFWASTRLDVRRIEQIKQGETVIGQKVQVQNVKSRYSPPFQKCTFDLHYDTGVSNESSIFEGALALGYLEKAEKGSWVTDVSTGHRVNGKNQFLKYMEENPDYAKILTEKVLTHSS